MKQSNQTFHDIFQGRKTAYGVNDNGKHYLIKSDVTPELMDKHLLGAISIGRIPIREDNTCKLGAIDLDDHKKGGVKKDFNYKKLIEKIKLLKLPLTVFKSKSGGAHCYLFLDKFYPARDVRHILKKLRYALGYNDNVELFPKQDKVSSNDYGNFINLPYKGGNSRVLINSEGKELNFDEGMEYASKRIFKLEQMKPYKILADKEFTDSRNERLFRAKQFFKKINPDDYENKVLELNKLYDNPLDENEVNATVLKEGAKDYWENPEQEELPKAKPYNMADYRALGIKKPTFIIERLFKDKSINYEFGPKGTGKTEFALGLANALARGKPFLDGKYDCPKPYPVLYVDFEMDSYDILERDIPYLKYYGGDAGDYFHLLNWEQQIEQNIPDIQGEAGQNFILGALEKQKELVGKPPLLIIDNLRSASGYDENDSNDWRPIGKWFLKLKGLKYPSLILDHTGYDESHMRGTSSKSDWSYVNMGLKSRRVKGNPNMVIDIFFDKARGLIPSETDKFAVEYDFNGKWSLTKGKQEVRDGELCAQIIELRKAEPKITQLKISEILEVSTGTISKLCKKLKDI